LSGLTERLEPLTHASRSLHVPFGLRDGRLYEPSEVVSGLECGCTCPSCGARLVARHSPSGSFASNFAHHAGADCAHGFESAVHLAAKQLIADRCEVFLPVVRAHVSGVGVGGKTFSGHKLLSPAGLTSLSSVRKEEPRGNIRPDLLVTLKSQEVLVEIAVTHFVDDVKLARIRSLGLPAVEIDVSGLREMNFAALRNALFTEAQKSEWLWHPKREQELARLQALMDADLVRDREAWDKAEAFRLHEEAAAKAGRQLEEKLQRILAHKAREASWKKKPDARRRAVEFRDASEPQKLRLVLEHLGADEAQLREFLPVHVAPRGAIAAAPLVWQAAVFTGLILPAFSRGAELPAEAVRAWVQERFEVPGDEKALGDTVGQFLGALKDLGLLHHLGRQDFLVAVSGWPSARAVVADARQGGVVPLAWVSKWPQGDGTRRLAEVFGKMFGASDKWLRLAGLRPEVRGHETVEDTVRYYAESGLDASGVRRFFLAAGFVRLAGA